MMRFVTAIFLLVVISCTSQQPNNSDYLKFKLKKTPCYGECPVFELNIYTTRTVELIAEQHLDLEGMYMAELSKEKYEMLIESFNEANFFEFEDQYTSNRTDFPSTFVTYNNGEQEKTVEDYDNAPQSLKDLEEKLESLINELDWIEVED